MPTLTIEAFTSQLKALVQKHNPKVTLKSDGQLSFPGCALDYYIRTTIGRRPETYTRQMKAVGMAESDAWLIMAASDNRAYGSDIHPLKPEVRKLLLDAAGITETAARL